MQTKVLKIDSRTRDEILHRAGNNHTARLRFYHDARASVDCDASDVVAHQFAFAGVHARADLNPQLSDGTRDRKRATDRPRRSVQGCQKPVTGRVGFLTAVSRK